MFVISYLLQIKKPRYWYPEGSDYVHDKIVDVDISHQLGDKYIHSETDKSHNKPACMKHQESVINYKLKYNVNILIKLCTDIEDMCFLNRRRGSWI